MKVSAQVCGGGWRGRRLTLAHSSSQSFQNSHGKAWACSASQTQHTHLRSVNGDVHVVLAVTLATLCAGAREGRR